MNNLALLLKQYKNYLDECGPNEYSPKKSRDLKAVSFEWKTPLGVGKYLTSLVQCTEWDNGEGFDFSLSDTSSDTKIISLHIDQLEAMLSAVIDIYDIK